MEAFNEVYTYAYQERFTSLNDKKILAPLFTLHTVGIKGVPGPAHQMDTDPMTADRFINDKSITI